MKLRSSNLIKYYQKGVLENAIQIPDQTPGNTTQAFENNINTVFFPKRLVLGITKACCRLFTRFAMWAEHPLLSKMCHTCWTLIPHQHINISNARHRNTFAKVSHMHVMRSDACERLKKAITAWKWTSNAWRRKRKNRVRNIFNTV